MEFECHMGNIRIPCTLNQALALLLQKGLPKIDNKHSTVGKLVFITHIPLSIHGYSWALAHIRDEIAELRKVNPVNGSIYTRWIALMDVPRDCADLCRKLSSDDLNVIWQMALEQKAPLTVLIKMFAS
ncbi:MAG: hypothetical protein ACOYUZ_05325 [Patescibacteria group bacterium]